MDKHTLPIKIPSPASGPSAWRALLLIVAHDGFNHISKWFLHQVDVRWGELYPGMMYPDENGVINPKSYTVVNDLVVDADGSEK